MVKITSRAEAHANSKLVPFETKAVPRFPLKRLPKHIRLLVRKIAKTYQVSTDFVSVQLLGAESAALTGKIVVQVHRDNSDWSEPANVYIICVLPSGSTKSPVHTFVWEPFELYEAEKMREVLLRRGTLEAKHEVIEAALDKLHGVPEDERTAEDEATLFELHDELTALKKEIARTGRRQTHDYTQEALANHLWAEGVAIANPDEVHLPTFFGTRWGGKSNITIYLIAHSGKNHVVQRVTSGTIELKKPHMVIVLTTQPDPLRAIVADEESRHRGLFARFLVCVAPDTRGTREWDGNSVPEEWREFYHEFMRYFLMIPEDRLAPKRLILSEAASAVLGAKVVEASRMSTREEYAVVADWLGKYAGHCSRIAGLLHMLEQLDSDDERDPWDIAVSAETVEGAAEITDYFLAHTLGALHAACSDPIIRVQKIVLRKMLDLQAERNRLTFNNIWQQVKGRSADFKSRQALHDALDGLALRNFIREIDPVAGKPGRPGRVFRLHPDAASAFPPDTVQGECDAAAGDDERT
jgi:hypothetical protein